MVAHVTEKQEKVKSIVSKKKAIKEYPYDAQRGNPNFPTSSIKFPTIARGSVTIETHKKSARSAKHSRARKRKNEER